MAGKTGLAGSFFSSVVGFEFDGFVCVTFAVGYLSVLADSATAGSGFLEDKVVDFLPSSLGALGSIFFSGFVTDFVFSAGLLVGFSAGLIFFSIGALVTTEVRLPALIRY